MSSISHLAARDAQTNDVVQSREVVAASFSSEQLLSLALRSRALIWMDVGRASLCRRKAISLLYVVNNRFTTPGSGGKNNPDYYRIHIVWTLCGLEYWSCYCLVVTAVTYILLLLHTTLFRNKAYWNKCDFNCLTSFCHPSGEKHFKCFRSIINIKTNSILGYSNINII